MNHRCQSAETEGITWELKVVHKSNLQTLDSREHDDQYKTDDKLVTCHLDVSRAPHLCEEFTRH